MRYVNVSTDGSFVSPGRNVGTTGFTLIHCRIASMFGKRPGKRPYSR